MGGTLLTNALNITGSERGYIVAGGATADTIDMSGFSSGTIIGSILFGKGGNDIITGSVAEDDMFGGANNDTLDGKGGFNFAGGGTGNDTFNITVAGSTNDFSGEAGIDTISYTTLDLVQTFTFNNTSTTTSRSGGNDVFFGMEILQGGGSGDGSFGDNYNFDGTAFGFTTITGGAGGDTFSVNTAGAFVDATLDGGDGLDVLNFNAGATVGGTGGITNIETVNGSVGNDSVKVLSGSGAVTFLGGGGDDTFIGAGAADNITGGAGIDTLTGGGGADVFKYTTVTDSGIGSLDKITDFVAGGAGDKIDTTTTSLAILADQTIGSTLANLTLSALNTLVNSTDGTLTNDLSGGSDNVDVMQLTTSDSKVIWVIDVDGSGVIDSLDTVIEVTGLSGTLSTGDFV